MRTWLLTIALFFACAAPAHAYIYWTDGAAGTIGRANLDGSGVKSNFITGAAAPRGIAVDEDHIYWAGATTIGRADLDGSDVDQDFITAAAVGLAVDGSYLYWTTATGIGRASLDGSNVNSAFVTGENGPIGLGVNGLGIYWSDAADRIRRANLAGSGVQTVSTDADDRGLAVDANRIVWADGSPARFLIGDIGPTGTIGNVRTQAVADPRSVALDDTHFYWTKAGGIGRINRDGTALNEAFIAASDPRM
ncbi:MAG TPA: hypothetical protein VFX80_11220, partial [Solirubrobacteraceae bacterium]|nr:hypothetical protein [Solirubrobacteraceae bacterium]